MHSVPHHPGHGNDPSGWMNIDINPNFYSYTAKMVELLPPPVKAAVLLFKVALEYVLAVYTLPIELLLRWRWGTRALSLFQICYLIWLPIGAGLWTGNRYLVGFFLTTTIVAIWQFCEARRWEARPGVRWRLSYYRGDPVVFAALARFLRRVGLLPSRLFTEEIVTRFLEPAAGGLVGLGLYYLFPGARPLAVFLLISSTALLLKRHILHLRQVELSRDRRDAVEIGQMLSEAAEEEREEPGAGARFLVQLAPGLVNPRPPAPTPLPGFPQAPNTDPEARLVPEAVPTPPGVAPTPSGLPSWILEGRVVSGPDTGGRLKVACPGCGAKIGCRTGHRTGLQCPRCKAGFVFALPGCTTA